MNTIVSVTGPSGVGKTTISKIISICLGYKETLILSGDDCHLWERNDENWKFKTHLDPQSNNLDLEYEQISALKQGQKIDRSFYDHSTGKFTEPKIIKPKKYIVYEGLHSMYGKMSELPDISFYIEVDKSLKNQWKIQRDTKKRGYSIEQAVKAIERRKKDERKFIEPQREACDIVIKFKKNETKKIEISFDYQDPKFVPLVNKIKHLYSKLQEFIFVSKELSLNEHLVQNKGGNLSFKHGDVIVITESGHSFSDVNYFEGFGFYDKSGKSIFSDQKRPSMEINCHLQLGPCCLHTHPLHALAILCSKESEETLTHLFNNIKILDYLPPGDLLAKNIKKHKALFLKNHGIFISGEDMISCLKRTIDIDEACQKFLDNRIKNKKFLFPDGFVLEEENKFYHSYIKDLINSAGLTGKFLKQEETQFLNEMEEEKYRRNIK